DAGVPPTSGFETVQGPWGPGRKSSGELFRSMATPLDEGPLRWRWGDFSFGVGGQYFARGEVRDGRDFTFAQGDEAFGVDHRARLSARASFKERVGVLLEFQDVRGWGTETNTTTVMPNTGLHQGFVDVKLTDFFDLRVGRQELSYGEDRLIGNLDWAQAARAFDGVFFRVTASKYVTLDGFGMLLSPPSFMTATSNGARFHNSGSYFTGLYARGRFGKAGVDVYTLGLLEDPGSAALGARHDNNRLTVGARGFGTVGWLSLLGEAAFQTGKSCTPACVQGETDDTVLAVAMAARATVTLPIVTAPYVSGEFSAASGDGTPRDGTDNGFHQLFPTGHIHLGYMDYVGWQNVVAGRGTIGFRPLGAHVWLDVWHFAAWDPRGAWYAANGSVFVAADPTRTNATMGTEVDLSVTVPLNPYFAIAGNVSMFFPGAMSGRTDPSTWGFLSIRSQL
ncbi:MAG TPA: alginate export family protein, partial [Archangium sp.]